MSHRKEKIDYGIPRETGGMQNLLGNVYGKHQREGHGGWVGKEQAWENGDGEEGGWW